MKLKKCRGEEWEKGEKEKNKDEDKEKLEINSEIRKIFFANKDSSLCLDTKF